MGQRADLGRPALIDGRRRPAVPDLVRRAGQLAQRTVDARNDEVGADEGESKHQHAEPYPAQRIGALQARARQEDPVLVVVDTEAHPRAANSVPAGGELRAGAELALYLALDQLEKRPVRYRHDPLARVAEVYLDLLFLGEIAQQLEPLGRVGGDERGSRQVHHAGDLLRDLARARLALARAEDLQP